MSELTKEWLQQTIAELEEERDATPGAVNEDAANALAAMKIALASLEAEPVAYIFKHPAGRLFWSLTDESNKGQSDVMPVYTAQPAPVFVPDELTREEYKRRFMEDDDFDDTFRGGWKAHRAAMLQGDEPVTTAYKLPEGWVAVPVEPTEEMIAAAMCSNDVLFDKEDDTLFRVQHGEIWRAMLSAAPQQEVK